MSQTEVSYHTVEEIFVLGQRLIEPVYLRKTGSLKGFLLSRVGEFRVQMGDSKGIWELLKLEEDLYTLQLGWEESKPLDGDDKFRFSGELNMWVDPFQKGLQGVLIGVAEEVNLRPTPRQKIKFELWQEGYAATVDSSPASRLGTYEAYTFSGAVRMYCEANPDMARYVKFNPENRRWETWGCKITGSEAEARASFG